MEIQKESENQVHAKDEPMVQAEKKKIPIPVNLHRESDMKKNTEHPATAFTEKESIVKQIKAEQKPVSIEPVQTAERPPQPKMSVLASKYPRLKEIEGRLKDQNKAIFGRERKRNKLKKNCLNVRASSKAAGVRSYSRRLTVLTNRFPI